MQQPEEIIEDQLATVLGLLNRENGYYCFMVDRPYCMKLWASDELDSEIVKQLFEGSRILYSAELDDEGDMVMDKLEVLK